jgi:hypothetical protein
MKPTTSLTAALVAALTLTAQAAEVIKPQIAEPLRDAAVTRAPDGTYYLTGTRAITQRQEIDSKTGKTSWQAYPAKTADGQPDFMNNDGIKVWSSKDLVTWKEEKVVLDLFKRPGWRDDPLQQLYFLPERPLGAKHVRGLTSPRMAFLDGKAFLTFSMLGRDVRWLRAESPAGPWKDGRLKDGKPPGDNGGPKELRHINGPGNGSLFQDKDSAAYLLWGPGYIAKIDAKQEEIDYDTRAFLLAQVAGYPNAEWCAGQFHPTAFSLTLKDGKYLLTWSAFTDVGGSKRNDSFYATADKLMGPYSEPQPLIPGSGPVALFETDKNELMASCSIGDQPVFVPLAFANGKLAASALPELPAVAQAAKPGKIAMFDYANAKPSGKRAERVGEELKYKYQPVFADKPSTPVDHVGRNKLVPLFDLPIADVSICKGGDEAWYLTGTVASRKGEVPDFENNDGIYLWRSTDLDTWTPLGKVWDIEKDGSAWAKQYRIPGDNPVRNDFARGVTAPEIHFLDGAYYLAYSMNGRGTGLLKSKSGKAEGPYEDVGRLTGMGESPSLFADTTANKTYWLFGQGLQVAELAANRASLAGAPRDFFLQFIAYPVTTWDTPGRSHFWDLTAPFLFKATDPQTKQTVYALAFSAVTQPFQRANRDAMVAVATALDGPFQAAVRMIPNGGQATVFPGSDGTLFASFAGADPSALFRDRAAIVPMEWFTWAIQWPRMVQGDYSTTRGPWSEVMPPQGVMSSADPEIFAAPDGYFYSSASPQGLIGQYSKTNGGLRYWRAKTPQGPWEDIGWLYTMEQMRDDPNWPEIDEKYTHWNTSKMAWEPWMGYYQGTYWITMWFGGKGWGKDVCWKKSQPVLLRSESGKATGPYKLHWIGVSNMQGLIFDETEVYGMSDGPIWRMNKDLNGVDETWTDRDGSPLKNGLKSFSKMTDGRNVTEDCNLILFAKLGGKYIFRGLTHHSGYDTIISWADDVRGPLHYLGTVPNLGNAPLFKNSDGKWYTWPQCGNTAFFGTPYRLTDKTKPGDLFLYEVVFDMDKPEPSLWPAHDLGHLDESVYRK